MIKVAAGKHDGPEGMKLKHEDGNVKYSIPRTDNEYTPLFLNLSGL